MDNLPIGGDISGARVDRAARKIYGVAIALAGLEATGHTVDNEMSQHHGKQLATDAATLQTALAVIEGRKVKAKVDHVDGLHCTVGTFENFRIDGTTLRGDFTAFETAPEALRLLELADTAPEEFGVSMDCAYNLDTAGEVALMRISEVSSIDFVEYGAVTRGLFSRVDSIEKSDTTKPNKSNNVMSEKEITALTEKVAELETTLTSYAGVTDKLAAIETQLADITAAMTAPEKEEMEEKEDKMEEHEDKLAAQLSKLEALEQSFKARLSDLSKLGIRPSAPQGTDDAGKSETFEAAMSAKLSAGKNYPAALSELQKEKPSLIEAECKRRGITNPNLL